MGMRMWRMLVALLGVIGVAALAPGLALADAPITGQVTDAVTGNGISGVVVNLYNASTGMAVSQAPTGSGGDYNLGSWPNGTYQVQFVDGVGRYAQLWYNGKQSQSQATTITVSGTTGVTVNQALQPDMVTGQVTDQASGQPISGVAVELLSNSGTKISQTTSDSGGNYSFSAIPAATYEVAFNPGDANTNYNSSYYGGTSPTGVQVGESQTVSNINGQLVTDGGVTGQLTDQSSGQPIPGIEVELLTASGTEVGQTTTDGGGNYGFSAIRPGTYEVAFNPGAANGSFDSAYYGGASATGFQVNDGQTTSNINGQLITGGAIGGTITNSAHQPLANVFVQIINLTTGYYYSTQTGSNGTYLLDGLPGGNYQVEFRPGGGEDYVYQYYPDESNAAAAQPVAVTAGQTSHADASLATAATISGRVTDASGAPVSGVRVFINNYGGGGVNYVANTEATTDSNGSWSLIGLPTGTYQVEFLPPYPSIYAFQYYNDATGEDPPTPVTLTAGTTTSNIDAALTTGGQISGTVTNGMTGVPAAGVYVAALDSSGDQLSYATTDSQGNYTLPGLSPSASYRVEFSPASGSPLATEFYSNGATLEAATPVSVTVGQTTPNIDETLSEGGSISGVVTDAATGYSIGGVRVTITDDAGEAVYTNEFGPYTDQDGTYDVTNLAPGSYKVEFSSEGALGFQYYKGASTLGAATSVTVAAGQEVTGIDGALTEGGSVKGRVTDASTGQALADAEVEILDARGDFLNDGFTDANGQYTVSGIAPGTYYVEVMTDNNNVLNPYQPEFYGESGTLAGSTPVTITAGATTAGIDIAVPPGPGMSLSPSASTPTTTTTTTTPPPPVGQTTSVMPGPPTLSGGSVAGLGKGKPVVRFRLASGSNGARKLKSFKVKLPAGLAFVAGQLSKGVKVTGGGKVTEKLTGGQLVVTLGSPAKTVTVSFGSPAVKVTAQLEAMAASKRAGTLKVTVTVTPVNGTGHMLSFAVKNPS